MYLNGQSEILIGVDHLNNAVRLHKMKMPRRVLQKQKESVILQKVN